MPPSYRCSDASTERAEPMLATGSQVRGWLLIEVKGAWGEDAIHASALGPFVPRHWKEELKRRHLRAVCIRSAARDDADDVRLYTCAAPRPGSSPAVLWQREVPTLADVADAAAGLGIDREPGPGWERAPQPVILVCTNGRHDQCCANRGRPLVRVLRDSPWADRVWECSHVGGDRFAANLVVLPDSVYFGRVEPEQATALLSALDDRRIPLANFRGRTSYSLAEQAVEHFVRSELGIEAADGVVVEPRTDDGSFPVHVAGRAVRVRISRRMVSIADPLTCSGRAGQLVPEFTLTSIT